MNYKFPICLAFTLLLSACQTTSLRTYVADEPNQARYQQEQDETPEYQAPSENQMRMFVFTDFEQKTTVPKPRPGYFVDFEVTNLADEQLRKSNQSSEESDEDE